MDARRRIQDITLEDAYRHVLQGSYGRWKIPGNYMNIETPISGNNVETWVFLGQSIFIFGLSVEKENLKVMASPTDFIDIWPSVKVKYPQLFQEAVKGELCLIL